MDIVTGEMVRACLRDLERAVLATTDRRARISRIKSEACDVESSCDSYRVTVSFADRSELKVFLKDYGSFRRAKDDMEARRERELDVYRNLLATAGLDTARFYGSVRDHARGQFWLFLEFVEGVPLKYLDFDHWLQAARWLARLHGYFAQHPDALTGADLLVAHDTRFFLSTAERARRSVHEVFPARSAALEPILLRYERLVDELSSQPKTLVHGAFRPAQILVDASRSVPRFCPVDWELAALGSSAYDLASLADGFTSPRLDHLLDAYRTEAVKYDIHVPAHDELKHLVAAFRLRRVLSWLSKAVERKYPEQTVSRLTLMACDVAASVMARS